LLIRDYKKLIAKVNDNATLFYNLAYCLIVIDEIDEGLKYYQKAIEINKKVIKQSKGIDFLKKYGKTQNILKSIINTRTVIELRNFNPIIRDI